MLHRFVRFAGTYIFKICSFCDMFQRITQEVEDCLQKLNQKVVVGLVGGSDLCKISEQMDLNGQNGKCPATLGVTLVFWAI